MKVIRDTPKQLIIENNPIWLAVFISVFGLVFMGISLVMLSEEFWVGCAFLMTGLVVIVAFNLAFTRRTQFIFDGPGNLVEMRRKSLLGFSKHRWALEHLDGAIVQSSRSDKTTTYRAALVFGGGMDAGAVPGTVPVTFAYSSGKGADLAANAVNRWLAARD